MPNKTNRRGFLASGLAGGAGVALSGCAAPPVESPVAAAPAAHSNPKYAKLDEILKQPVLKRQLFSTPVIIETLDTPTEG